MEKKLSDQEVADFLAVFRERKQEDQEASPIWQELVSFPGWGAAKIAEKAIPRTALEAPPDPRMPAAQRAEILRSQGAVTSVAAEKTTPGAMTMKGATPISTPWSDTKPPDPSGFVFIGIRTDVPPPFPGKWERLSDGWIRRE